MMRRLMVCIWVLLASAVLPCAAQTPADGPGQGAQPGQGQKVIRDPVEYNAYINALNTPDPAKKAAAMEAFVARYPNSAVLEDALEQALAAYQQAGKTAEVEKVARRILQLDENNVRALAVVVALTREALTREPKSVKPADLRVLAERGLRAVQQWEKPEALVQDDFDKLLKQLALVFYGAAGFGALLEKDYSAARDYYSRAVPLDPDDLANTYQLSIADLEMTNTDVRGFWYVARAIHLCEKQHNVVSVKMIADYGQAKYRKYHGSMEGWEEILHRAATAAGPPRDFQVERAALPAGPAGTAASLTSNSSPGNAHSVPASILSSDRTSAGISPPARDVPHGAAASVLSSSSIGTGHNDPASVLSSGSPGSAHSVSASVLSSNTAGTAHNAPASITSSTAARAGKRNRPAQSFAPIPASLLRTGSSSVALHGGATALSDSLRPE